MNRNFTISVVIILLWPFGYPVFSQQISDSLSIIPVDKSTGLITYQEVVMEEGTKNDFFNRAVGWVNETYKNPTSVTTVRDAETGKIEGNYRFKIYKTVEENVEMEWGTIMYSFKLEFKDGRYRYTFNDILLKTDSRFPVERWLDKASVDYNEESELKLRKIDTHMKNLVYSLKLAMQPKITKQEEAW